ncbi:MULTISPECIES: hypothetical protein [unclassified Xanthomonas]|uniref:hypothetical protein n=1 Tax=unclassified Xanthomonas TaxID=2643310 RepID=UPI00163B3981|nr:MULTISPECIES: hypothetical protein [unclassified Xanthomonas]
MGDGSMIASSRMPMPPPCAFSLCAAAQAPRHSSRSALAWRKPSVAMGVVAAAHRD